MRLGRQVDFLLERGAAATVNRQDDEVCKATLRIMPVCHN